jgi:phosphopantothenoylcysteine decarboxylase/phosphopantothenate--cysteine ligase
LACGDWGQGKLADTQHMIQTIKDYLGRNQDLKGIRILVTAGPTREYLDPVRFISNPSTGKMGFAIAAACVERGAEVDLVAGPTHISPPVGVHMYPVETAQQMYENVIKLYPHCDIVFKTAAVGDYRPKVYQSNKIKKENEQLSLLLIKNPDILKELGRRKEGQVLVGFAAETQDIRDYAIIKLHEKNLDFILANDVTQPGAGFKGDTNQGILFTRQGDAVPIPLLDKKEFAHRLIDEVVQRTAGLCIDIEGKKL